MSTIFDTCDVMYNWYISLLQPIVLDNLFGIFSHCTVLFCSVHLKSTENQTNSRKYINTFDQCDPFS